VTLPAALVCVLAGVGWARLPALAGRRLAAVAIVLALPGVGLAVADMADEVAELGRHERLYDELPEIIAAAGGREAVLSCGTVHTGPFQTQALAWELHVRQQQIGLRPEGGRATIVARRGPGVGSDTRFAVVAKTPRWVARSSCPR
jgi:hypothetical protein